MADKWSLYEALLTDGYSTDRRDVVIEHAVSSFMSGMQDDPAYQKDSYINGKPAPIMATRKSTVECEIKATPNTDIHIGDIVECLSESWIVVELYSDKVGILNGTMWLCNDTLRFQNNSEVILTEQCVIDNGTYSKNTSNSLVSSLSNTYRIYISLNEHTRKLYVDKRLSVGITFASDGSEILEVYKIIGVDTKSKNFGEGSHLTILTLQRDVYDANVDSIELGVCDAYINTEISTPTSAGRCCIDGRDVIRIGVSRDYEIKFLDKNGSEIAGIDGEWEVNAPNGIIYEQTGNKLLLTVPLNEELIGEHVTLNARDIDGLYGSCELKVQVVTVG